MIYFHAVSTYQLLYLCCYRRYRYANEPVGLIVRTGRAQELKDKNFLSSQFDVVMEYDDQWKQKRVELQEQVIEEYFDKLFETYGLVITGNDEFYVACAHNTFGMYLSIKQISFHFVEDAAGHMSRPEILDEINQGQYALKYELICKYHLIYGDSPFVKGYLFDPYAQREDVMYGQIHQEDESRQQANATELIGLEPEIHHFCLLNYLEQMEPNERQDFIQVFTDTKVIEIPENAMVILTQHFTNMKIMTFDEQKEIYQLFVDYFTANYEVVIKPHPDDLMYYGYLLPSAQVIRERFPAEFLPYLFSHRPAVVATISSTSTLSLRTAFHNILELGNSFESEYKSIHKYYFALEYIAECYPQCPVHLQGVNQKLVENLCFFNNLNVNLQGKAVTGVEPVITLIDSSCYTWTYKELQHIRENSICIFLNNTECYELYSGMEDEIWKQTRILRVIEREDNFSKVHNVYIVAKGDEQMDSSANINISEVQHGHELPNISTRFHSGKILNNSNMVLEAKLLDDPELQVQILEGMIQAYQDRLMYYINKYGEAEGQ